MTSVIDIAIERTKVHTNPKAVDVGDLIATSSRPFATFPFGFRNVSGGVLITPRAKNPCSSCEEESILEAEGKWLCKTCIEKGFGSTEAVG